MVHKYRQIKYQGRNSLANKIGTLSRLDQSLAFKEATLREEKGLAQTTRQHPTPMLFGRLLWLEGGQGKLF